MQRPATGMRQLLSGSSLTIPHAVSHRRALLLVTDQAGAEGRRVEISIGLASVPGNWELPKLRRKKENLSDAAFTDWLFSVCLVLSCEELCGSAPLSASLSADTPDWKTVRQINPAVTQSAQSTFAFCACLIFTDILILTADSQRKQSVKINDWRNEFFRQSDIAHLVSRDLITSNSKILKTEQTWSVKNSVKYICSQHFRFKPHRHSDWNCVFIKCFKSEFISWSLLMHKSTSCKQKSAIYLKLRKHFQTYIIHTNIHNGILACMHTDAFAAAITGNQDVLNQNQVREDGDSKESQENLWDWTQFELIFYQACSENVNVSVCSKKRKWCVKPANAP